MGPPISIDGKRRRPSERDAAAGLQWGRRLASTERPGSGERREWQGGASMGPPISIDGKRAIARPDASRCPEASMGPPISIDGKLPTRVRNAAGRDVLQWGRRL